MTETWTTRGHPHPIREARAIIDAEGNYVAYVHPIGTEPKDVARADARAALLVSAPRLRAEREMLREVLEEIAESLSTGGLVMDAVEDARDALELLEGTP